METFPARPRFMPATVYSPSGTDRWHVPALEDSTKSWASISCKAAGHGAIPSSFPFTFPYTIFFLEHSQRVIGIYMAPKKIQSLDKGIRKMSFYKTQPSREVFRKTHPKTKPNNNKKPVNISNPSTCDQEAISADVPCIALCLQGACLELLHPGRCSAPEPTQSYFVSSISSELLRQCRLQEKCSLYLVNKHDFFSKHSTRNVDSIIKIAIYCRKGF